MTTKQQIGLEDVKRKFAKEQIRDSAKVLWATFFISLFFIANGSMLVYESEFNSGSSSQNVGLIVVGSITLFLTLVLLVFLTYAGKHTKYVLSVGILVMMMLGVMFGASLGVLSLINGVDVPNNSSRNTLGWVFGGITTGLAVISTFVCIVFLWWIYFGSGREKYVNDQREREIDRALAEQAQLDKEDPGTRNRRLDQQQKILGSAPRPQGTEVERELRERLQQ